MHNKRNSGMISGLVKQAPIYSINDTNTHTTTRHVCLANRNKREDPSSQVRKPFSYNGATNMKNLQSLLPVIL